MTVINEHGKLTQIFSYMDPNYEKQIHGILSTEISEQAADNADHSKLIILFDTKELLTFL